MTNKLLDYLYKLDKDQLIGVLDASLDNMQSCNGRKKSTCVLMALDAKNTKGEMWKLPNPKDVENTIITM